MSNLPNEVKLANLKEGEVIEFHLSHDPAQRYIGTIRSERNEFGEIDVEVKVPPNGDNQDIIIDRVLGDK